MIWTSIVYWNKKKYYIYNFEQEFEELVKINKRINEIEQSKKKLELD